MIDILIQLIEITDIEDNGGKITLALHKEGFLLTISEPVKSTILDLKGDIQSIIDETSLSDPDVIMGLRNKNKYTLEVTYSK